MTTKSEQHIHQCECAICQAVSEPVTVQYHHQVNLFHITKENVNEHLMLPTITQK